MQAFQAIADANPGLDGHRSRNSGEPGYRASVDYVARLMRAAGYSVTIQPYTFTYTSFVGTPTWRETTPTSRDFQLVTDWNPRTSNGAADADVEPAGGIVLPPTPTSSSTSGCTAADFSGFTAGHIALIQRGGCNFGVRVLNAQAAGGDVPQPGVEGVEGRARLRGRLLRLDREEPRVPVTCRDRRVQLQRSRRSGQRPPDRTGLCKSQEEVDLFGGTVGNYEGDLGTFDGGCVDNPFRWCDNLDNNDPEVLTFMSKAFADMAVRMAFDTKVMSASNDANSSRKLPIGSQVARHFVAR